jgi:hypothetical protein
MAYTQLHENPEGEAGKGCSPKESFYGGERVDGEEVLVTGRRSGRGGRRSGQGGAPWRRGTHGRVGEIGNNHRRLPPVRCSWRKKTAGELSMPGFASRHRRQVLGAGGAR